MVAAWRSYDHQKLEELLTPIVPAHQLRPRSKQVRRVEVQALEVAADLPAYGGNAQKFPVLKPLLQFEFASSLSDFWPARR